MFGSKPKVARTVNLVKDPAGTSAINLTKMRDAGHINLVKSADKAGIALSKCGLAGIRAQAVLILDHSGSMSSDYASGKIQKLVERVLGFALQIDVDGTVPVIAFDYTVKPTVEVNISNYQGIVQQVIWQPRNMGSTNLTDALIAVQRLAEKTNAPLYVAIVTDGAPDNKNSATKAVCELSQYPAFLKFLALQPVDYLDTLDNLDSSKRLIDNVDSKSSTAELDLLTCSDLQFQEAMVDEWDTWIVAAQKAGILV